MKNKIVSGTEGYASQASFLLEQYENFSFEESYPEAIDYFPEKPCKILDIGSGTGRDAAWFDKKGHEVLAAEPTKELREGAIHLHPSPTIRWVDDSLPDLEKVRHLHERFDFILMNAVWMHLDKGQREEAMSAVAPLLSQAARLFISLRHGPVPRGRRMFAVSAEETIELASRHKLVALYNGRSQSILPNNKAAGIWWTKLIFEREA
ncbi:class I SAM-dependent methyltransferase [Parasphingorhabdus cellanae]|uniref:Class I SAM-dependent methyltransferase n=1 Tax=Parasphingorhabdus cellanae TaxID=2806553 RepID=A0ABX7T490_9SPHN|nr:class I SAM-dependent methyltransferase [Parasphingorhabdus cellanae]QTD55946.1 class I SAM-dependent methyltransferase [Parasphingorhabdus cellanae]